MEARDAQLNLDDYAEFEQRGRSHTWPERQLAHLEFGAVSIGAADPGLSPRGYTPTLPTHESSTNISAASSTNLTEALKSNLSFVPEPDCGQESELATKMCFSGEKQSIVLYSKKVPFRTQSEMRLPAANIENMKSNSGTSYPSHFSEQNLNHHVADALPILSLPSHSPLPQTHPQAVSHSNLNASQNIAPTNDSAQLSVLKLVSAAGNTSDVLCLTGSGENLSASPVASPVHHVIGSSVRNLTMVPVDSHTASNSGIRFANNNSVSITKSLPASGSLSSTASSTSNISTNCATSQVLTPTVTDLNAPVPYYTAHMDDVEESVERNLEDRGKRRLIKKKRVRKRVNGLISIKKPNPWGAESYSELISRALKSTFNGRMRLSEIYNWFASNVPYFGNRTSQEQSAGWKNSIRHNLSLHSRFMRIQNEGAGKSSWWVINPDAKPGRNPRRQRSATLETTTKIAMDKKRRGARKKVMEMSAGAGGGTLLSAGSSIVGSQASVLSRELYAGEEDSSNFEPFRSRTQSNLSLSGSSSRVSPSMIENYENFDNFDFPPFVEAASAMPHDILDRTNEMNLNQSDSPAFHRPMANPMLNGTSGPASSNLIAHIKTEPSSSRTENSVQPPPSYHELDVVRGIQNIQNPLLRTHLIQNRIPNQPGVPYIGSYSAGSSSVASSNWMHSNVIPVNIQPSISCAAQQSFSGNAAALPMDLENLALPDQPLMEVENMEAVIRHELSQSAGSQLSFDNI
ncbi:Fork head domain family protein [Acanthocheilonema viteae]|uniref:Forkhead box protein O n=1 Tax=Acanthocheilonema viteae TaxID=6277 RepID=A0A498SC56_ACAVI|nr:unnamed protein product [Acanthocheilonema viteae]